LYEIIVRSRGLYSLSLNRQPKLAHRIEETSFSELGPLGMSRGLNLMAAVCRRRFVLSVSSQNERLWSGHLWQRKADIRQIADAG
jgi:hypothetical protein